MAAFLYIVGILGLIAAVLFLIQAPMISAGGAIAAVLLAFLMFGMARLLEHAGAIERNSGEAAKTLAAMLELLRNGRAPPDKSK